MKVKEVRIWLGLNIDGKNHSTVVEKTFAEPISKEEIDDALIIDIIKQDKKIDITHSVAEIRNFISHEIRHKDHPGELFLEDRYDAAVDAGKLSEAEIAHFLLLIYGIKTKKMKKSEVSWDDETEKEAGLSAADLKAYSFPPKMLAYLEKPENLYKKIIGASDAPTMVELRAADKLKLTEIEFYPNEEHIGISSENLLSDPNYSPEMESEKSYRGKAIELIRQNDLYSSDGLLVWIVELKVFGTYDPEHGNLTVFPDATATEIQKDLGTYLQAQWSYGKDYIVKCGNVYDYFEPWKYFRLETGY